MKTVEPVKSMRVLRKGSGSDVIVVHPDGTRSQLRVPTRSMNERVREEAEKRPARTA